MSGMMLSRVTRVKVGALGVPPCLITSAVPSQLLPTNRTGVVWVGAAAPASEGDAATTLAASTNAAITIISVFLPEGLTDTPPRLDATDARTERAFSYPAQTAHKPLVAHGTNTPCTENSVFGPVSASPSVPPSNSCTWPSCQIARAPSAAAPGTIALKLVSVEHVAPIVVSGVAAHGTVAPNPLSSTVEGSSTAASRSVIRVSITASSSP